MKKKCTPLFLYLVLYEFTARKPKGCGYLYVTSLTSNLHLLNVLLLIHRTNFTQVNVITKTGATLKRLYITNLSII